MRGRQINPAFLSNANKEKNVVSFKTKFKAARAEGILNLSSSLPPLQQIPKEVFQLDAFIEEDEKFWEVVPLSSLDLSFNKIVELPQEIGSLGDCISLKMRNNLLQSLPDSLFTCPIIRHLDFDNNKISMLSNAVGQMNCLKEFILSNNQLRQLPENLFQIASLLRLELQNNQLTSLGSRDNNWSLTSILYLNIANNKLVELPDSICNLLQLETLYCQSNALNVLPDLSRLHSLKFLDASQNQLTRFPILPRPRQGQTLKSKLVHVYLGYNQILEMDVEGLLGHAASLSELMVHNNRLGEVSGDLEALRALKVMDVSNNNIRDLPAALGWMANLQRLKVDGNSIKSIRQALLTGPAADLKTYLRTRGPSTLAGEAEASADSLRGDQIQFRLRDITGGVLDLSGLGLAALPGNLIAELSCLPAFATLHTVNLGGNGLSDIPRQLGELLTVKAVHLSGNRLNEASPPDDRFGSSRSSVFPNGLTSLDVSMNRLSVTQLDFIIGQVNPRSLTALVVNNNVLPFLSPRLSMLGNLRVLRASFCGLTSIEDLDFGALPGLETLDVSNNKLESLGWGLFEEGCGQRLEYLSLENNCLVEVSSELARLPCLKVLLIGGNPQRTIRNSAVQQGSAKVIELLRNKLMDGSAPPAPLPTTGSFGGQPSRGSVSSSAEHISHTKSSYRQQSPPVGREGGSSRPFVVDNSSDSALQVRRAPPFASSRQQPPPPPAIYQTARDTTGGVSAASAARAQRSQALKAANQKRFTNAAAWDST
jgi:Leucine-rich repeat (LRR) protein